LHMGKSKQNPFSPYVMVFPTLNVLQTTKTKP
jgi:hypothetical protein